MAVVGVRTPTSSKASAARTAPLKVLGNLVQLGEQGFARMLRLVLRRAGPQRLGEISPEPIEASIGHLQDSTDVFRAVAVEKRRGFAGVRVNCLGPVTRPLQQSQSDERVREIRNSAGVEPETGGDLRCGLRLALCIPQKLMVAEWATVSSDEMATFIR